ncbi:hypothetical protein C8J57DRAFT_1251019 [Mycena rebaudengoi]|nr:hypothetical protein C8J57DRAFT_1252438 [Mycena rebaudengoi]KAJ7231655.1 hypothetical protein C8J57DRAFT_1251019 [Mycena rebaudengoi]
MTPSSVSLLVIFFSTLADAFPARVPLRSPPTSSPVSCPLHRRPHFARRVPRAAGEFVEDASGMTRAEETFYRRAHSPAELRTFYCEKVRKMPLSGLDPSMLIGFARRDEADMRKQIALLPRTIFAILDEPPTWLGSDDDDKRGLEIISDPEEECVDAEGGRRGGQHTVLRRRVVERVAWRLIQRVHAHPMISKFHPVPSSLVPAALAPAKNNKSGGGKEKKAAAVPVPSVHSQFPVSAQDGATGGGQQQ